MSCLQSKAVVVNVMVKRRDIRSRHVWVGRRTCVNTGDSSKFKDDIGNQSGDDWEKAWKQPVY